MMHSLVNNHLQRDLDSKQIHIEMMHALAQFKWAAARVNRDLHRLDVDKACAIACAAQRISAGEFDAALPHCTWQTESDVRSNALVNALIASIASRSVAGVDPDDDVNIGQSTHEAFAVAVHIAVAVRAKASLLPVLYQLRCALVDKVLAFDNERRRNPKANTLGRTFADFEAQIALCQVNMRHALADLNTLAIGGDDSVRNRNNAAREFGPRLTALLARQLDLPLMHAGTSSAPMIAFEALVVFHGSLRMLALALGRIARSIRSIGGESAATGGVDLKQLETLTMACAQVRGQDAAIGYALEQGNFALSVYKPLIAVNTLGSMRLLAEAMRSFTQHCVAGIPVGTAPVDEAAQGSSACSDEMMINRS